MNYTKWHRQDTHAIIRTFAGKDFSNDADNMFSIFNVGFDSKSNLILCLEMKNHASYLLFVRRHRMEEQRSNYVFI